jgi:hypothetical protein
MAARLRHMADTVVRTTGDRDEENFLLAAADEMQQLQDRVLELERLLATDRAENEEAVRGFAKILRAARNFVGEGPIAQMIDVALAKHGGIPG